MGGSCPQCTTTSTGSPTNRHHDRAAGSRPSPSGTSPLGRSPNAPASTVCAGEDPEVARAAQQGANEKMLAQVGKSANSINDGAAGRVGAAASRPFASPCTAHRGPVLTRLKRRPQALRSRQLPAPPSKGTTTRLGRPSRPRHMTPSMQVLEIFVPQLFPSGAFVRHRILLKPADLQLFPQVGETGPSDANRPAWTSVSGGLGCSQAVDDDPAARRRRGARSPWSWPSRAVRMRALAARSEGCP